MVVFQDAMPKKAHYRKFARARPGRPGRLRGDGGGGLPPVRAARRRTDAEEYDEGFAAAPNLVVIDGGKGQLSAALAAMQAYDLPRVAVIALAKRIEEVFVPGPRRTRSCSTAHAPGLQLLQRIRDEAHRFALGFHRQRRDARARESIFDTLRGRRPGAPAGAASAFRLGRAVARGERRRSSRAFRACPAKTARRIYAQLHKTGRG